MGLSMVDPDYENDGKVHVGKKSGWESDTDIDA